MKLLALFSMPFAVFMVIATNSRGPTLALGAIFLFTSIPLLSMLISVFGRDARLLVLLILVVAATGIFIAARIGSVESDFGRLVTFTNDGAAHRSASGSGTTTYSCSRTNLWVCSAGWATTTGSCTRTTSLSSRDRRRATHVGPAGVHDRDRFRAWLAPSMRSDPLALLFAGYFVFNLIGAQVAGSIASDATWYGALLLVLRHEELTRDRAGS